MNSGAEELGADLALLTTRILFGGMMILGHGLPKLEKFSVLADKFPDPLGIGPSLSLSLAIISEIIGSAMLILGLGTRLAATQLMFTMVVAALIVHASDPFFAPAGAASKEFALVYLAGFLMLLLAGPGRFSIDRIISNKAA